MENHCRKRSWQNVDPCSFAGGHLRDNAKRVRLAEALDAKKAYRVAADQIHGDARVAESADDPELELSVRSHRRGHLA